MTTMTSEGTRRPPRPLLGRAERRRPLTSVWERLPRSLVFAAIAIAALDLAGWIFDVRTLRSVRSDYPSLKANSAVAIIALSLATLAFHRGRLLLAALVLPVTVAFVGLIEYAAHVDLGVNQLLFTDHDIVSGIPPGRESINAAVAILFLAAALLAARRPGSRHALLSQLCALCALVVSYLGLIGYLTGIEGPYGFGTITRLSLPGTLALLLLSLAALGLRAREAMMRALSGGSGSLAATFARLTFPFAVILPPLTLALEIRLVKGGLVTRPIADWVSVFAMTALLVGSVAAAIHVVEELEVRTRVAEQAHRKSERLFRRFIDTIPDHSLAYLDAQGVHRELSGEIEKIYGYSVDQILNTDGSFMRRAGDDPATELAEALRTGRFEAEVPQRRRDGTTVWVHLIITPMLDDEGAHLGYVKIGRDVTEERLQRIELAERGQELERSNKELEEFAYVASHDLSAPLRAISGYLDLIGRRYQPGPEVAHFMERAMLACVRMQTMTDDLLIYSRASHHELLLEAVQTGEVVGDLQEMFARQIEGEGARVEIGELPTVRADRAQLSQVLQNLIGNALKFHSDEPAQIRIGANREGRYWRFEVADNGIGIGPEHVEQLFKMFHRPNGEQFPGSGIGLTVCKRIVDRHGGSIRHEPAPGGGSVFSFTLPATEETCNR